jgi:hypothetical protein
MVTWTLIALLDFIDMTNFVSGHPVRFLRPESTAWYRTEHPLLHTMY